MPRLRVSDVAQINEPFSMDTPLNAELRPSLGFPPSAAYMQIRLGDHSATSFPWAEKTGHRTECGGGGIEPKKNVVADWLKALERSFGTSARMISAQSESLETGDGSVCRALDGLCGRRPLCLKVHSCMRRAVVESGCLQQIRCPLGFLLLAVPVQRDENGCSLLEFGPLGVEHKTRAQFEQGLDRLGFSPALRTHLRAPLNALRTVRAEDIDGVLALLERVAASIADEMLRVSSSARALEPKAVAVARRYAEHHIGDKISLVDVARHVALSPDHFSRLFRRKAGVSFGEYMNRCRVVNAQRLLGESMQRVGEISFACGFDSVPHFNRVFRRLTGTSPTAYRRHKGRKDAESTAAEPPRLQNVG